MANAFGILIGITLVVFVIVLLDWLGERKDRQARKRATQRRTG